MRQSSPHAEKTLQRWEETLERGSSLSAQSAGVRSEGAKRAINSMNKIQCTSQ
jgi:hypothetical protein